MARHSILLSLIGAAVLVLTGCDELEDPVIPVTTNYLEAVYGPAPSFESLAQSDAVKRVLVEDFTAHQCGNCPAAAIIAEDMVANSEGKISAMAIHAGNLANTDDGYFDTDWTTEEGDVFWDQLDFQANPVGRINRINGVGSFWAPAQWEEKAVEEMNLDPVLGLQCEYEWVPANGHLNLHLHGTFYDNVTGPIQVAWLILESHIFDYQLDYSADPEVVAEYEFNHVLRGSVHGALGIGFGDAAGGAAAGDVATQSATFEWNDAWVIENATVLAVVTDANGYVLNVAEIHMD
ncbi:MAG: Omp28-related outer membrane protein [Flavobacteriales bacterium]